MSRPRRSRSSSPARATAYVGTCRYCARRFGKPKRCYAERKHARAALRVLPDRAHMSVYRCPSGSGYWHLGHAPEAIVRGTDRPLVGIAQIHAMARNRAEPTGGSP